MAALAPGRLGRLRLALEPARAAMLAEVEKLKAAPVTPGELGKAVKLFISATLASRKTRSGQASDLGGGWLAANDLNFSETQY